MLAVTEEAVNAIDTMLDSPGMPEEAGMRITAERTQAENGAAQTELRLQPAEAPEADDKVVEDARVFVEPQIAELLDDKVLDADMTGEQVEFQLREQAA